MMTQASYYIRVTHATPEIDGSHLAEVQYVDYPPKSRDIDPQVTKSVVHGSDLLLVGNQTTRTRIGPPRFALVIHFPQPLSVTHVLMMCSFFALTNSSNVSRFKFC